MVGGRGSLTETEKGVVVVALLASVAVVAALWVVDYLPTHDGPQSLFQAHLVNHYADAAAGYSRFLQPSRPVTSLAFAALYAPLERLLPWRDALRATLSIGALTWGWGFLALVASIDRRRIALGLFGFVAALQWALYMGFFSFYIASGLSLGLIALAIARAPWTRRDRFALSALLFVDAVAHLFAAEVAALVLVVLVVVRARSAVERARELALLAAMGLPTMLVAYLAASRENPGSETVSYDAFQRLALLGRTFVPGPAWRGFVVVAFAVAGLALLVARASARRASRLDVAVGVAAALLVGIGLIAPMHLRSWEFFSARFLPLGVLLAIALLPVERLTSRRAGALAVAGVAAFTFASTAWASRYHAHLRALADDALAGLDAPIRRSGPRLALVLDPYVGLAEDWTNGPSDWDGAPVPFAAPTFNVGALYGVAQGGMPSWTFATRPRLLPFTFSAEGSRAFPSVHDPIRIHDPRVTHDPAARRGMLAWLAALGVAYDDVILSGSAEDAAAFVERGYTADFQRAGLFIGRALGCSVEIGVVATSPLPAPLVVEYGVEPIGVAAWRTVLPVGSTAADGRFVAQPARTACGDVWVRARFEGGGTSRPPLACEGARLDGRLSLQVAPGQRSVECRLGARL